MTTIAFDGEALAADRKAVHGSTPVDIGKVHKITFRGEPAFAAFAGTIEHCLAVIDWLRKKAKRPVIAKDADDSYSVLIVTRSLRAYYLADTLYVHDLGMNKWAIGSGAQFAMGAMAAGKSAEAAVAIAGNLDINTGIGIDVVYPGRL